MIYGRGMGVSTVDAPRSAQANKCPDEVLRNGLRHLDPQRIDWILHTYAKPLGLGQSYAPHPMRVTYITMVLKNEAKLEDGQRTVGHANPATTQLYDRRRFMPAKSATLMVAYRHAGVIRATPRRTLPACVGVRPDAI
jgi:integrase